LTIDNRKLTIENRKLSMARVLQIAVSICVGLGAMGCGSQEKGGGLAPAQAGVKIGDIGPSGAGGQSGAELLKTINFSVYIIELPAENIDKLAEFWSVLDARPLRFNSPSAFKANSFSVGFGQVTMWDKVYGLLRGAGGQELGTVSLLLADDQASDLAVTGLDYKQKASFVSGDLSSQSATIGPGILALRIKATKMPTVQGACTVVAHPVFTVPITSPVPELAARSKAREFPFTAAAFGLKMSSGDFVALGPEKYIGDLTTLSGLFFSNPAGSLFFDRDQRKPPERKPAVRIFLLVCVRIPVN
jgi:hypothetical protein